jgi:hypothetical protein
MQPAFFEFAQKRDGTRHARMQASLRSGHPQRARRGAPGVDCRVGPGNDEGGRKRAGGVGRGRARCGGIGQRHGNLLERADLRPEMLNQDPRPCPVCFCNASRLNEGTCTAWNIATHAY